MLVFNHFVTYNDGEMPPTIIKRSLITIMLILSLGFAAGACSGSAKAQSIIQAPVVTTPPPATSQPDASGTFTITFAIEGKGSISPAPGPHTYHAGDIVTITATEVPDWVFNAWLGSVPDHLSKITMITVTSDQTITAYFSVTACYLDF